MDKLLFLSKLLLQRRTRVVFCMFFCLCFASGIFFCMRLLLEPNLERLEILGIAISLTIFSGLLPVGILAFVLTAAGKLDQLFQTNKTTVEHLTDL